MTEKVLKQYTFGRWVIVKPQEYYFYWQGKSPKVKEATEEYLSKNTGLWNTLYDATMKHIAVKCNISMISIGTNARNLITRGIIKAESGPEGLTR